MPPIRQRRVISLTKTGSIVLPLWQNYGSSYTCGDRPTDQGRIRKWHCDEKIRAFFALDLTQDDRRLCAGPGEAQPSTVDDVEEIGEQAGIDGNGLGIAGYLRRHVGLGVAGLVASRPQVQEPARSFQNDRPRIAAPAEKPGDADCLAERHRLDSNSSRRLLRDDPLDVREVALKQSGEEGGSSDDKVHA